jgi:hypothetical protein
MVKHNIDSITFYEICLGLTCIIPRKIHKLIITEFL